jgi:hypothetical protein
MKPKDVILPLNWWKTHPGNPISQHFFCGSASLGIHGSHIEIDNFFINVVGMLTSLQHCRLKVNNLKKLVIIMKIWLVDAQIDCS